MKGLIIAEKPSLARNIMSGIREKFQKADGYCESENYIVSWAFGHLFTLCDASDYDEKLAKWRLDTLPFIPDNFKFKLRADAKGTDSGIKKQFEILKKLYNRKDVNKIINAGDADREGEVIIRLILNECEKSVNIKKAVYRLWLPDQTPETIGKNLKNMKPDSEYDNLYNEGLSRMCIDWLYGINLTRFASVKSNTRAMRVGRVLSPIVRAIYDRDMEIKNFVPQTYFCAQSKTIVKGVETELTSAEKYDNIEACEKRAEELNSEKAVVCEVRAKQQKVNPGKLFSLSKLQGYMGKAYKMPPDETLKALQKLYENGYATYPRTNTEYLAEAEKSKISDIINILKKDYKIEFKDNYIFNDKKIESHSAVTPTLKIPDINSLSGPERKVYESIVNRFAAVFCSEECIVNNTEITVRVHNEDFVIKGRSYVQKGFMMYDAEADKNDKILPALQKGEMFDVDFKANEKKTQPLKPYTVETFSNYLKNPFRNELKNNEENDDEEYKAVFSGAELGTEATRTSIIDNAVKLEYISLKNNVYHIEPKGIYLAETAEKLGISLSKEKTAMLGKTLKSVYRGEITPETGIKIAADEISEMLKNSSSNKIESYEKSEKTVFCECPHCGGDIIENSKAYSCGSCRCVILKNDMFFDKIGKKMTKTTAKELLTKGRVHFDDLVSKKGKKYSADIVVSFDEDGKMKYSFKF